MRWLDISISLRPGMAHWPDDPPLQLFRVSSLEDGDDYDLSAVCMGLHTGTHIDAPCHFLPGSSGIDALPLEICIGPARMIEVSGSGSIGPEDLMPWDIGEGERLLLKTDNSRTCCLQNDFRDDYAHLSPAGARWLAERRVRLVGIDYFSIAGMDEAAETHRVLLRAGVWILEGLDLAAVAPGRYHLVCLPLLLPGRDGAPARAVLGVPD